MSTPGSEAFYEVAANVDITRLALTQEEGLVVARILGRRVTLADLAREGLIKGVGARDVLESLVRKGALLSVGGASKPASTNPYAGMAFSPADLAEAADLTEEQRKRILFVEHNLGSWSHYKLLDVRRTASVADIKAAYFKASREFHPDAFFRKNLGSFKDRIERVFKGMKAAYDTLSDPQRRAVYDETAVIELTPEDEAELERLALEKRKENEAKARDARTVERMRESRLKRNPMADRIKRGRDLIQLAEDAFAAGRLDEAANQARLAMTFDEADGVKERARRIVLEADRARAQLMVKRVKGVLASPFDMREMADEMNRVVDQAADIAAAAADAALLTEVGKLLLALKRPVRAAKLAQQATELDARNPRAFEVLAEAASADGKWAIAGRAAERWLQLDPKAARAKELVKEAKRNG